MGFDGQQQQQQGSGGGTMSRGMMTRAGGTGLAPLTTPARGPITTGSMVPRTPQPLNPAGGGSAGAGGMGASLPPPGVSPGTNGSPFNFQQSFNNPNTQLAPINQIQLPQQRFDLMRQNAANQINRSANIQNQDLQRQFGSRGVGRSGLEMQAAQEQYRRGAGQQIGDVNRQLSADEMGQNFQEAQKFRDLNVQRNMNQATLNQQGQQAQAGENLARSQLGLQTATGLGNLGLAERQQALTEFGARDKWENPGYGLAPLYQAAQAAAASGGGGKK